MQGAADSPALLQRPQRASSEQGRDKSLLTKGGGSMVSGLGTLRPQKAVFKWNLRDHPLQTHFTDGQIGVKGEEGCVYSRPGRIPLQGLGDKFPVPIQYIEQTESQFDE